MEAGVLVRRETHVTYASGGCTDIGCRVGGQGARRKRSPAISHILKAKLKVRAHGLNVDVSERVQADSKAFWPEQLKHGAVPNELGDAKWVPVGDHRLGSISKVFSTQTLSP